MPSYQRSGKNFRQKTGIQREEKCNVGMDSEVILEVQLLKIQHKEHKSTKLKNFQLLPSRYEIAVEDASCFGQIRKFHSAAARVFDSS